MRLTSLILLPAVLGGLLWLRNWNERRATQETLFAAVEEGDDTLVQALLDRGVSPNLQDSFTGDTPLLVAFRNNRAHTVELLLQRGADAGFGTATGDSLLGMAAARSQVAVLQSFLAQGADPNSRSPAGRTPLMRALGSGQNMSAVRGLLAAARSQPLPEQPFFTLSVRPRADTRACVRLLLDAGAEVEAADREGAAAIHLAACLPDRELVERLIAVGADANAADHHRITPLHCATVRRDLPTVRALLARKANPNARDEAGLTPLFYAASLAEPDLVRVLLEHGADRSVKGKDGRSAIELLAPRVRREQAVLQLLRPPGPRE